MTPILIAHIAAGTTAIAVGAAALSVRKGAWRHRLFGTLFVLSMLAMAVLAAYLAIFVPPVAAASAAPPKASVAIAMLTVYLVATGWMTVRRGSGGIGMPEKAALAIVAAIAVTLVIFGLQAGHGGTPYFTFAAFGAFAAGLDLKVIVKGGIAGTPRIARHLWRMCTALFFASAFFFIGQQKVMPLYLHGSPFLIVPAVAPLVAMVFWLIRIRLSGYPK